MNVYIIWLDWIQNLIRNLKGKSIDHKDIGYKGVGCIQLIQDTV